VSRAAAPPPVASLRGAGFSFDDFARYMHNEEEREEILAIFDDVVRPLLKDGASVHLISHSWGTVVAWEGLRRLDSASLMGRVANLFVVGSALSLGPVKSNLRKRIGNLNRPVHVNRFYNLDARGDVVGGPLDRNFGVDREFLALDALGCSFFDIGCAHSSYFQANNLNVNRDIFAKLLNP
jgi:pimeloyl-ACP methyl ester carboxylesterase